MGDKNKSKKARAERAKKDKNRKAKSKENKEKNEEIPTEKPKKNYSNEHMSGTISNVWDYLCSILHFYSCPYITLLSRSLGSE
jgi:hypothetical protein